MNSKEIQSFRYDFDIKSNEVIKIANYYAPFSLRVSEELISKIRAIAKNNKRSANKEMEFVLEKYVAEYEKENGTIKI